MSVKQMSLVWELDLDPNKKIVLLAYADHADDDGDNVYPSLGRVAHKTGYSTDQVRRISKELTKNGYMQLVEKGQGRGKPHRYKLTLEKGSKLPPFKPKTKGSAESEEKVASEAEKGGIAMPPEPSTENHQEPSESTDGEQSSEKSEPENQENRTETQQLMDSIYLALKDRKLVLDGNEYGYNLGRINHVLNTHDPTEDELDALPKACVEYFEWYGTLDIAKALRRYRQQGLRRERESKRRGTTPTREPINPHGEQGSRAREEARKPYWYATFYPCTEAEAEKLIQKGLRHGEICQKLEAEVA